MRWTPWQKTAVRPKQQLNASTDKALRRLSAQPYAARFGSSFSLRGLSLLLFLTLLLGCRAEQATPTAVSQLPPTSTLTATATQTPEPTATITNTPTPQHTSTPTLTPSPTPTPTPTALPITVQDDLRAAQLNIPYASDVAPCGYVDIFDFPIDPPNAANVSRGGGDFNIFRSRFDKYHAGEDWGGVDGTPNLGTPVYSIGHGLVTYAEPEGWNRDKGVVIVQHTYGNNRQILSFYGHLDPPSVTLEAGECVERGDLVGNIGNPRSSPHLHFEIRTQSPYAPLSGYWPTDPREVGWVWPSQTIWESRLRAIPGVSWVRSFTAPFSQPLGQLDETTFALLEDGQLLTLDVTNGRSQPHLPDLEDVVTGLLHQEQIYLLTRTGRLLALSQSLEPQWENIVSGAGVSRLLPLPSGGVAVSVNASLQAFGKTGGFLWRADVEQRPFSYTQNGDQLLFSTEGNDGALWQIAGAEQPTRVASQAGKLLPTSDQLWLYGADGLYRTGGEGLAQVYPLPESTVTRGDLHLLPDGRLLLVHVDARASRLLLFSEEGELLWQRQLEHRRNANHQLLQLEERPFLLTSQASGAMLLHEIDLIDATLTLHYQGGTRTPLIRDSWAWMLENGRLLLNIGGGAMSDFMLDE